VGARFSTSVLTGPDAHRTPYKMGTNSLISGVNLSKLTTHFHLVSRLRMRGAIPLLPLCASMAFTGKTLHFYVPFFIFFTFSNGFLIIKHKACCKVNKIVWYIFISSETSGQYAVVMLLLVYNTAIISFSFHALVSRRPLCFHSTTHKTPFFHPVH
jgi:hypothetical protein